MLWPGESRNWRQFPAPDVTLSNFRNHPSFPSTHPNQSQSKLVFPRGSLLNTWLLPQDPKKTFQLGIRKPPPVACNTSLCISCVDKPSVDLYENTWKIISILVQAWAASHTLTGRRRKTRGSEWNALKTWVDTSGIPGARGDTVVTQLLLHEVPLDPKAQEDLSVPHPGANNLRWRQTKQFPFGNTACKTCSWLRHSKGTTAWCKGVFLSSCGKECSPRQGAMEWGASDWVLGTISQP